MKKLGIWLLRIYQNSVSAGMQARCRYTPTCSAYAVRALEEYPFFRALPLIVWRLLRCNPFSHGGKDPVPADVQGKE